MKSLTRAFLVVTAVLAYFMGYMIIMNQVFQHLEGKWYADVVGFLILIVGFLSAISLKDPDPTCPCCKDKKSTLKNIGE